MKFKKGVWKIAGKITGDEWKAHLSEHGGRVRGEYTLHLLKKGLEAVKEGNENILHRVVEELKRIKEGGVMVTLYTVYKRDKERDVLKKAGEFVEVEKLPTALEALANLLERQQEAIHKGWALTPLAHW